LVMCPSLLRGCHRVSGDAIAAGRRPPGLTRPRTRQSLVCRARAGESRLGRISPCICRGARAQRDGESVYKRDSVGRSPVTIHLCGLPEGCRCRHRRAGRSSPLLDLAPGGVCRAVAVTRHAGALLPHRFTLTCGRLPDPSAVSLCCTVREVAPTWLSPAPCPSESRLSSTRSSRAAVTRPTHHRSHEVYGPGWHDR